MSPSERRENRLGELCRIVDRLADKGHSPEEIIKEVTVRARKMVSSATAYDYVEEVIRRFSKNV